jgi:hypothetical protein
MASITFTKDFANRKKGEVFQCSRDTARLAIGEGVAEMTPVEKKEVKKTVKAKTK